MLTSTIAEIQRLQQHMLDAKFLEGHVWYADWAELTRAAKFLNNETGFMVAAHKKLIATALLDMQELYRYAYMRDNPSKFTEHEIQVASHTRWKRVQEEAAMAAKVKGGYDAKPVPMGSRAAECRRQRSAEREGQTRYSVAGSREAASINGRARSSMVESTTPEAAKWASRASGQLAAPGPAAERPRDTASSNVIPDSLSAHAANSVSDNLRSTSMARISKGQAQSPDTSVPTVAHKATPP